MIRSIWINESTPASRGFDSCQFAEGHTREHTREYYQHVCIARGALAELATHFEIAVRLHYVAPDDAVSVLREIESLSRRLTRLRDSLDRNLNGAS